MLDDLVTAGKVRALGASAIYGYQFYNMREIALAWHWANGMTLPIVGATKASYLDDAASVLSVRLTAGDIAYLEEPYAPHRIVGAIDHNPPQGVLLDEKK